jgi:integrase
MGDDPTSIRDRGVLMLLALYGLRRGEVTRLCLEDLDWDAQVIRITRPKQRRIQHYPLIRPLADALWRYPREVRAHCQYGQVFLAMKAPTRPLVSWPKQSTKSTRRGAFSLQMRCSLDSDVRGMPCGAFNATASFRTS